MIGPASDLIVYHYVVEGDLRIRVDGERGEGVTLGAGDVALLPRNDLHLMGSDLSLPPVAGGDVIQPPKDGGLFSIHHGGGGGRTQMICGFLGCAGAERNPMISTLPPLLTFNVADGGAAEWIRSTLQYGAAEVAVGRPGSETMLAKLSEVLFLEAVRRYAETLPDGQTGWLAGLRDPYVGRALALLHRDITRRWTVDDLGREVGLSRSAWLTVSFISSACRQCITSQIGACRSRLRSFVTPARPLHRLLKQSGTTAFSRAFKKAFGAAPATWRRSNS